MRRAGEVEMAETHGKSCAQRQEFPDEPDAIGDPK
jgi:hypothetical protein